MSESLLALKDVTIERDSDPRPVLDRFSLTIERGETVIMLGEADAGKDALMRALAGVPLEDESLSGKVQFGIGSAVGLAQIALVPVRMAYLPGPASRPLSIYGSAASQLARVIAHKAFVPRTSARAELAAALSRLNGAPTIEALETSPARISPEVLAWGLLACAVATTPELLLVDHLLVDLPPTGALAIVRALVAEQERQNFAILYNCLSTEAVRWLGGRLVVMRHGHIVDEGPLSRLTTSRSHAYTQSLFKRVAPADRGSARVVRGQPVIQAQGISLMGREKLNFELCRGGSLALIGERGSGRHALARQLIGLERVRSGRVVFNAVDLGVLSETMKVRLRRRVAIIAGADDVLDPRLTLSDTVTEPLRAALDLPRKLVADYRDAALKHVGLSRIDGNIAVARLSAFDKRRLQVARAMVCMPMIVLIDEPLRGLDAFGQSVVRDLLQNFRAEKGPAYLVITSDMSVAQALAENAMVFKDGRVVEQGALTDILRAPRNPQTRQLIEAAAPML